MKNLKVVLFIVIAGLIIQASCSSIPPEFITTMEAERSGIVLLEKRHRQTVNDLVDNWYEERLARMNAIKKQELKKITIILPNPDGGESLEVIESQALMKIEQQFNEAMAMVSKIRSQLIEGYLDADNWRKLVKIHDVNLEMAKSLLELNKAQRNFYHSLVGDNAPFPADFLNEKTKDFMEKSGLN